MAYSDYNAAITTKWDEEEKLKKQAAELMAGQEKQASQTQADEAASFGSLSAKFPTKQAESYRSYKMQIEALKDQLQGLNIPSNFLSEKADRAEKPWKLYPAGSLASLMQQEQALQENLQSYLVNNLGYTPESVQGAGWEELLKELLGRLTK